MCVIFFIIWNLFQKFYWRGLNQTLNQVYLSWATFWNLFDLKLWWRWIHTQIENPTLTQNFEITFFEFSTKKIIQSCPRKSVHPSVFGKLLSNFYLKCFKIQPDSLEKRTVQNLKLHLGNLFLWLVWFFGSCAHLRFLHPKKKRAWAWKNKKNYWKKSLFLASSCIPSILEIRF